MQKMILKTRPENKIIISGGFKTVDVVDDLVTSDSEKALSANMGKILDGKKADKSATLSGYGITDAYTKTETDTALSTKADKTYVDTSLAEKADKATTLSAYGITDAYTKTEVNTALNEKAGKATTLAGYGITDAYTKTETDTALEAKADKTTTLIGYGITDAYTKTEADTLLSAKADITALEEYRKTAEAVNGAQEYEVSNTDSCLIIKNSAQSQAVELNITGSESGVGDLGEDEKYHIPIRVSGNLINPENFKTKGDTVYTYIDGNLTVTKTGTATNTQNKFSFEFPVEAGKTYVMYHKSVGASFDFDSGISVTSHNGEAYWSNNSGNVIYISGNSRIVFTASETKTITGYIGASVNGENTTYIYGLSIYEKSIADTYSSDIWSPYFEPAEYDISLDAALLNSKSTKKEITIGQGMNVIQIKTVNAPNKLSLKYLKSLKSIIKEIINAVVALGGTL